MSEATHDHYSVTLEYDSKTLMDTFSLVEATRFAAACCMHTGKRYCVRRQNQTGDKIVDSVLFSCSPSAYDFRRTTAETKLVLKAMAHELVENIDKVAPELPMEGPER